MTEGPPWRLSNDRGWLLRNPNKKQRERGLRRAARNREERGGGRPFVSKKESLPAGSHESQTYTERNLVKDSKRGEKEKDPEYQT